jgi:squalene synthase HpnC
MSSIIAELALYGPHGALARQAVTLAEAQAYCRRLARRHYENFTVASWLLPRELRPHFHSVYAYCRWADDLADETGDAAQGIALLDWWEAQLRDCYRGEARHPVFVALRETVRRFDIPIVPLLSLLVAFRQDQHTTRYKSWDELRNYCRHSANPVGRLVLYLGRCHDEERGRLADQVCTGLQLANFCQDVAGDWDRGRVYLPQEDCLRFGYVADMFARREANPAFRELLAFEVERAERLLQAGLPLVPQVPGRLAVDVDLFIRGGLAILQAIRRADFDVWRRRPRVGRARKLGLLAGAVGRSLRRGRGSP